MLTKITIYLTADAIDSDYWARQCFASWHGSEHFGHQISNVCHFYSFHLPYFLFLSAPQAMKCLDTLYPQTCYLSRGFA
jgi:hypothetical protein